MKRTIYPGLRKLFIIVSSYELIEQLGLSIVDQKILRGYWLERKSRKDIAKTLNRNPHAVSIRYNKIINQIKQGLQDIVFENKYNKQKIEELERIKHEYIRFHLKEKGKYPKFIIKDDLIENVNISQRLYNRLSERGINRLRDLKSYTEKDLLIGRNFGEETLYELIKIIKNYGVHLKKD